MCDYFQMLWKTPGMLSSTAVVAVDMTPFKDGVLWRGFSEAVLFVCQLSLKCHS